MKKKYTEDDSENEFSVDEPEELEESDDDWTPAANEGRGRRPARRGRQPASAKKPRLAERNSEEEEEEDEPDEVEDEEEEEEEEESQPESDEEANDKGKKRRGRGATTAAGAGRGRAKKVTGKPSESPVAVAAAAAAAAAATAARDKEADDDSASAGENVLPTPVEKEFTSGAFVVLKTDFQNQKDPPIWKIDGKALLQKYVPFEQEGKILYRNTSTYSGWSMVLKDRYYPAQITFKMQNRKETVVEFLRDKIKVDDSE